MALTSPCVALCADDVQGSAHFWRSNLMKQAARQIRPAPFLGRVFCCFWAAIPNLFAVGHGCKKNTDRQAPARMIGGVPLLKYPQKKQEQRGHS
jgi:hypothetical protein